MNTEDTLFRGRTFDDFLFTPQRSPVLTRREVDLSMPLAAGLTVGLPVIGANMDTVMGEEMAKTLALEGAFGFLHAPIRSGGRGGGSDRSAPRAAD
jgi:IMP dehydrogenase/GMP reductase